MRRTLLLVLVLTALLAGCFGDDLTAADLCSIGIVEASKTSVNGLVTKMKAARGVNDDQAQAPTASATLRLKVGRRHLSLESSDAKESLCQQSPETIQTLIRDVKTFMTTLEETAASNVVAGETTAPLSIAHKRG